jgi:DNA helicase-2/ATP-dependent DNA helicase PcrA
VSLADHLDEIQRMLAASPAGQGYLRVETERGERSYLLGPRTQLEGDAPMLDWRTSPLAEVWFRYRPGEAYELELDDARAASGRVRERWLIAGRGRVDALIGDDVVVDRAGERSLAIPAPRPVPRVDRSALPVLDPEQQAAVELSAETSLVLDGEAGVGKTLVALFRVAELARRARVKSRRFRALVLVPTEGLRRLVRLLAERLMLEKLEIAIVDDWLVERARAAFTGLPSRVSSGAHAQVIGLKRHPAVRAVLDDFVGWKPPRGVDDDKVSKSRTRLLHLFGDRDRLQRIVDASRGQLPARAIAIVMQHTRIQFETTTERAHRHVDSDRLVALDGRSLDAGTPTENVRTFDVEDAPVLFELARRGALQAANLPGYDHIVVDETQLRSPLELAAIGDALAPHASVTLAGDHRQATDESAWFGGWATAKAELRRARWAEVTLDVTYRSVPAISDFARAIVDRRATVPAEPPADPAVWATQAPHALAQAARLCWHLHALQARDPWRQICVIARTAEHARRLHAELSRGLDPTLVLDGDFRFEPGVIVTPAAAISGLEFDTVVIPDLDPEHYPVTPELARTLYVAATRARDWLWLTTTGAWSALAKADDGPSKME